MSNTGRKKTINQERYYNNPFYYRSRRGTSSHLATLIFRRLHKAGHNHYYVGGGCLFIPGRPDHTTIGPEEVRLSVHLAIPMLRRLHGTRSDSLLVFGRLHGSWHNRAFMNAHVSGISNILRSLLQLGFYL